MATDHSSQVSKKVVYALTSTEDRPYQDINLLCSRFSIATNSVPVVKGAWDRKGKRSHDAEGIWEFCCIW